MIPQTPIVHSDGRKYLTTWPILVLAAAWHEVRTGGGEVKINAYDAHGNGRQMDIRNLDAAKTFGGIVLASLPSTPPPPLKATG